ncbi:Tol-Pal system beta propeller repeat protein TolB [Thiococcus pfennigii]|jgi:TolB protein|uniref:Tol-Pal system beta propeller repeat protein TolB n=1 Tax=Thiococcus pfennigii TaxID=1057 RepID=UPI0019084F0A|nr:Tol-Pal system beta propeller repeat protein TolB [Thiococcus pfennigii]MBK1702204.1 Tol-Pal system beta propeller repeat protein TolB [Thiococcus pfennigii]
MYRSLLLLLALALGGLSSVRAELTIEVTGGVEGAQPIAVVPFGAAEGLAPPVDIAAVIAADLARTGRFRAMPPREMLTTPHRPEQVDLREWRLLGIDSLVIGEVVPGTSAGFRIDAVLFDVFSGDRLAGLSMPAGAAGMRLAAHRLADAIYEELTGEQGVFSTRIAYVTVEAEGDGRRTTLRVADADGHNPQTIVSSREPIMSPAWTPDGRRLAYVSFENGRSNIYLQELASGRRELLASYRGINGSPAFSPDGNHLAMTLSKDGNAEIYVLDLTTRELRRLTDHYAIDTEPAFSPDGNTVVFTSDRGGQPQIYRVSSGGGTAERVTFQNDYNARASFAPDGRSLALVTRVDGRFRIARLDLARNRLQLLSGGPLDESPSFAPNGSMIIYATRHNGRGVLAATSVDGSVTQRLSQEASDVREPAWSPFVE